MWSVLFLLYCNDKKESVVFCFVLQCTDNTTMHCRMKETQTGESGGHDHHHTDGTNWATPSQLDPFTGRVGSPLRSTFVLGFISLLQNAETHNLAVKELTSELRRFLRNSLVMNSRNGPNPPEYFSLRALIVYTWQHIEGSTRYHWTHRQPRSLSSPHPKLRSCGPRRPFQGRRQECSAPERNRPVLVVLVVLAPFAFRRTLRRDQPPIAHHE